MPFSVSYYQREPISWMDAIKGKMDSKEFFALSVKERARQFPEAFPPTFLVPPHRVTYKSSGMFSLRRPSLGGPFVNASCRSELWTFSTSDLAQVFGGTFPGSKIWEIDYDWCDEWDAVPIMRTCKLWVKMYPHGWFQNG